LHHHILRDLPKYPTKQASKPSLVDHSELAANLWLSAISILYQQYQCGMGPEVIPSINLPYTLVPIPCLHQCWAVFRMRERYLLVINSGICPLTHWFSHFSNNQYWHISVILKFFQSQRTRGT
jgi:hypothetical protein